MSPVLPGGSGFLDLGDLTGAPLFALACPNNLVGPVDVYLVWIKVSANQDGSFIVTNGRTGMTKRYAAR